MDNLPSEQHASGHSYDQAKIDQINQECYDNRASLWDRFPFPDSLPQFVAKYHPEHLGKRVLDVGSGTGVLARWLQDSGYEVLCLDPSPEMVRRCKEKGLQVIQCGIQTFQSREQFAMIFAILSLMHIPKADFAAQIRRLASLLPSKGILFLGMLEGRGEGYAEGPDYPRFFAYYSPEEILKIVDVEFTQREYRYYPSNGVGYMLFVLEKRSGHSN